MFLKWNRRQDRREPWETHSAYLVESIRTDRGPRHKHTSPKPSAGPAVPASIRARPPRGFDQSLIALRIRCQ